ncbi:MAG TPA: isochorismatase family cysteine hydrolase [Pirellulales bacterium]|jgi:nicotinamidase-related amidase|nr:isochorismatase family cysteine hydrolase [Pirellulales bacterium]
MMNYNVRGLLPRADVTRRGFVASTLAAAFALSVRAASAGMADQLSIEPKTTALLVMDFQTLIVEGFATDGQALLGRTAALLEAARGADVMVVYVVVGFRPGYPEISPQNPLFSAVKASGRFAAGEPGTEIHPAVAPKAGEAVVTKHRVGAFFGTDLDMILKAHRIETLILAGVATSGVVLSTVRHAADADYGLVVVGDCCSDRDEEVHRVLLEKVLSKQATVATAAEVKRALGVVR